MRMISVNGKNIPSSTNSSYLFWRKILKIKEFILLQPSRRSSDVWSLGEEGRWRHQTCLWTHPYYTLKSVWTHLWTSGKESTESNLEAISKPTCDTEENRHQSHHIHLVNFGRIGTSSFPNLLSISSLICIMNWSHQRRGWVRVDCIVTIQDWQTSQERAKWEFRGISRLVDWLWKLNLEIYKFIRKLQWLRQPICQSVWKKVKWVNSNFEWKGWCQKQN